MMRDRHSVRFTAICLLLFLHAVVAAADAEEPVESDRDRRAKTTAGEPPHAIAVAEALARADAEIRSLAQGSRYVRHTLGRALYATGDYRASMACFSSLLQGDEGDVEARHWRCRNALQLGLDDKALEDMRSLILRQPAQAGGYQERGVFADLLSPDALDHARKHVARMLDDRPHMKDHLVEDDPLVAWVVRKFAGEDIGSVVLWDPGPPMDGALADHTLANSQRGAVIRIRKTHVSGCDVGKDLSFEELWLAVVFESQNLAGGREFVRLRKDAIAGTVTREEYVMRAAEIEFNATRRTREFYLTHFNSWMTARCQPSNPRIWNIILPLTFDEWISRCRNRNEYPWRYFGPQFDYYASFGKDRADPVNQQDQEAEVCPMPDKP